MQPHSAVNDSNYDLIASPVSPWAKGESHSARMRRVDNMRRISYGPSLQPEGTISGFKDLGSATGRGWVAAAVLSGMAVGVSSGVPTGSKTSRKKGMRGLAVATLLGAGCGYGFANNSDPTGIGEGISSVATLGAIGALSHGFGRYVWLSLDMTKGTIPVLKAFGDLFTRN